MLKFDKKEGFFKNYHENGQLKEEGNFINGKKDGLWKFYYENGQLEKEVNYKDDKLDGSYKVYHENNQLECDVSFKNGKQNDGEIISYHDNGTISRSVTLAEGQFEGEFNEWHKNGVLSRQGYYEKGEIHGPYKLINSDNVVEHEFVKHRLSSFLENKPIVNLDWIQDIGPIYNFDSYTLRTLLYRQESKEHDHDDICILFSTKKETEEFIDYVISHNGGKSIYKSVDRHDWEFTLIGHLFFISYNQVQDGEGYFVEIVRVKTEAKSIDGAEVTYGIHKESKKINSLIPGLESLIYYYWECASDGRFCFSTTGSHIISYWDSIDLALHKFKSVVAYYDEKPLLRDIFSGDVVLNEYDERQIKSSLTRDSNKSVVFENDDFEISLGQGNTLFQMNIYLKKNSSTNY